MTLDQHGRESLHPRDQILRSGHGRSWNKNCVVKFPKYRVRLLYRGDLSEVNPLDSERHSTFEGSAKNTRKNRQRRFKQNHKALTLVGSRTFYMPNSNQDIRFCPEFRKPVSSDSRSLSGPIIPWSPHQSEHLCSFPYPEGHHRVLL